MVFADSVLILINMHVLTDVSVHSHASGSSWRTVAENVKTETFAIKGLLNLMRFTFSL